MNESRVVTLVYSVVCLIMGLSLAQWLGDTVAAACLFIAALMSWLQWQLSDMAGRYLMPSSLAAIIIGSVVILYIVSVLSGVFAVVRILSGLLA